MYAHMQSCTNNEIHFFHSYTSTGRIVKYCKTVTHKSCPQHASPKRPCPIKAARMSLLHYLTSSEFFAIIFFKVALSESLNGRNSTSEKWRYEKKLRVLAFAANKKLPSSRVTSMIVCWDNFSKHILLKNLKE